MTPIPLSRRRLATELAVSMRDSETHEDQPDLVIDSHLHRLELRFGGTIQMVPAEAHTGTTLIEPVDLNEYCAWTDTCAVYPGRGTGNTAELNYLILGLSGEVAEAIDAFLLDKRNDQIKELGDVIWYWSRLTRAVVLDKTVADVAIVSPLPHMTKTMLCFYLVSAVGRITERMKKVLRDGNSLRIENQLSEVFSIWQQLCLIQGIQPADVLAANVSKLESRKDRGKLGGSGDNR